MMALFDTARESMISWPLATLLVIAGVIGLVAGGHLLVEGAVTAAKQLGMSTLMIGLTIVSFGTSAPELALNVIAASRGETGLAFGNVIGSNIANLALVLGLAAFVAPVPIPKAALKLGGIPWLIIVTILAIILPWIGQGVDGNPGYARWSGVLLLALVPITVLLWKQSSSSTSVNEPLIQAESTDRTLLISALLVLAGLALLIVGGRATEYGAVQLARWIGLSEAVIGLSIVAVATSLPEVVTSVIAARRGVPGLAVGTVIGSNMFNLVLVLGTTAVIAPVAVPATVGLFDLLIMGGLTVLLLPLAMSGRRITSLEGLVLVLAWAAAIVFSILREVA
ncbi:MAG: calcium/sodium antiporter [Planctomycetota bacterium]|nr:calcium/sodium antiporter [Planctomycetota bacterium]